MNATSLRAGRLQVVAALARREAVTSLSGIAPFVALAVAVLAAAWMLSIDHAALRDAGLLVPSGPFRAPLQASLLVLAAFFAVSAATSVARERESGTLEVLFYGPVDELSYVLGKAGGVLLAYAATLPLLAASFALLSGISGFRLEAGILAGIALSILPVAEIVAFALLLSIGTNRIRTAMLLLVGVVVVLLGITLAYGIVLMIPIADPSSSVLPLRDALAAAAAAVAWLSPFSYLERIVALTSDGELLAAAPDILLTLVMTAALLAASALWLSRRGVAREGE